MNTKSESSASSADPGVRVLLDTHILIWLVLNDRRLSRNQMDVLENSDNELIVSPVIAYELTHLQATRRIQLREPIDRLQQLTGIELTDLPFDCWRNVAGLPDIHRDPIDRLLIAHSLVSDMPILTADANIRRYPVNCI
jgi:PIN domain nuclease of toxin-antitoxin system